MKRGEKSGVVDELRALLTDAKSAMLADFRGLNVSELTELRNLLYRQGVGLRVVKNSLTKIAARGTALEGLEPYLAGPTAVAFVKGDPAVPAKILASFSKLKPGFQIKGGFLEGRVLAAHEAVTLSELPPREVLLAKLAGAARSPLLSLVMMLHGPLRSLLFALEALRQRKDQASLDPQDPVKASGDASSAK